MADSEKVEVQRRHRLKTACIMLGRDQRYVQNQGGAIRRWIDHGEPWSGWLASTRRVFEEMAQALADAEAEGFWHGARSIPTGQPNS